MIATCPAAMVVIKTAEGLQHYTCTGDVVALHKSQQRLQKAVYVAGLSTWNETLHCCVTEYGVERTDAMCAIAASQ